MLTIFSTFRIVMLGLAPSTTEIMDNCKLAREMSQTSMVYYQGVITQISKLLSVMEQPGRQAELPQEWELVRNIQTSHSFPRKVSSILLLSKKRMSPPETKTSSARPPPPSPGGGAQAEGGEGQCRGGEVVGERRLDIWGDWE